MRHQRLKFRSEFRVVPGNRRGQCAEMTIAPGGSEGGPGNRHRGADQWLYVVSGSGQALIKGRRVRLAAGSLLFIPRGERHQIENRGREPLPRGRK
jgi:mannose-6-phosphate isomerase-like protein (cupin superfamily)